MADRAKKVSELTAANTAANTDYLLIVTNTAGTAVTKRINYSNVIAGAILTGVSRPSGEVMYGTGSGFTSSNTFVVNTSGVTVSSNSQFARITLTAGVTSSISPDTPNNYNLGNTTHSWGALFVGALTTLGNTVAAQVNATSLNISGLTASGNTTVAGFVNVSTYGTFGGTVNAAALNVSGLTSISNTGLITAPQVGNIIPFYYGNQAAFPAAATYHGAIAHSHSDGKMYFAHSGSWNAIVSDGTTANVSGINISSNTINLNGVTIARGDASTRLGVNTQIGSAGSNGSIYLSTAGKIYLKVANTGVATDDWQRVTTTSVD
jgi:hypothetical protein